MGDGLCARFCVLCVLTAWCLFWKYDLKNAVVVGANLNSVCSFCRRRSCETVSYAFERSMYIASVGLWAFLFLVILLMTVCSAKEQFECGRKAYCVGEIILFAVRWSIIWLLMMVSSSLAMIGRSDIGR